MQRIISIYIIQLLIFNLSSKVQSLKGQRVMNARDYEFPFIASFQYIHGEYFCTGTLITSRHILTAAHCLKDEHPDSFQIVLGVADLLNATRHRVASWHTYNSWAGRPEATDFHDIAVVLLTDKIIPRKLNNQPNISPVPLSELNKKQVQGKQALVLGWGCGTRSRILKKAIINILRDDDCFRRRRIVTNKEPLAKYAVKYLCTAAQPHVLLEQGDSGGPLLDQYGRLLGIHFGFGPLKNTSWSIVTDEFLQKYQVNLHPSIDYYRHFIVNVTNDY